MLVCAITLACTLRGNQIVVGCIMFMMSLAVIGVHGMLSGTATMDFGGKKAAATATGLVDGFVYLGTGFQAFALGRLTNIDWIFCELRDPVQDRVHQGGRHFLTQLPAHQEEVRTLPVEFRILPIDDPVGVQDDVALLRLPEDP